VPPEVLERLGGGKRPPVIVEVNGYRYETTVGSMGGQALIPFSSDHRAVSGIAGGDDLDVGLTLDRGPREVAVPDDLADALRRSELADAFAKLPPSHRKAHVTAVESAKGEDTRRRRVEAVLEKLRG
jgi:hypothetical protein